MNMYWIESYFSLDLYYFILFLFARFKSCANLLFENNLRWVMGSNKKEKKLLMPMVFLFSPLPGTGEEVFVSKGFFSDQKCKH